MQARAYRDIVLLPDLFSIYNKCFSALCEIIVMFLLNMEVEALVAVHLYFVIQGRSPAPLPPRRDPKTTLSVGRARARSMVTGLGKLHPFWIFNGSDSSTEDASLLCTQQNYMVASPFIPHNKGSLPNRSNSVWMGNVASFAITN
jgi:hypothetical protein